MATDRTLAVQTESDGANSWGRLSRYTLSDFNDGSLLLVSTGTGAVARIEGLSNYDSNFQFDTLSLDEMKLLRSCGFFSDTTEDEELARVQSNYTASQYRLGALSVTITPSLGCNFSCYYCFEKKTDDFKNKKQMNDDTATKVIDYVLSNLSGRSALNVRWFGGEPLMALSVLERTQRTLSSICDAAGIPISSFIQTNGLLLTAESQRILHDSGINDIHITLDGNRTAHDRVRFSEGGEGSYCTILDNIKRALERFRVVIRFNVTPKNVGTVQSALDDLSAIDPDRRLSIYFSPVYSHYNGTDSGNGRHAVGFSSVREFAAEEIRLIAHLNHLNFPFDWSFLNPRSLPCSAVKADGMMIGPDGSLMKCDHDFGVPENALGDVDVGMNDIKKLQAWLHLHPKNNPHCPSCPLLPSCLGYCGSIRKFVSNPEEACPSKKFNYQERISLGRQTLAFKTPLEQRGRVKMFRRNRTFVPAEEESCGQ